MRRLLCSVVVAAGVAPLLLSGSGAAASKANGVVIPAIPHEKIPAAGKVFLSSNWSGYAVKSSSHSVTSETATFKVPTAHKPPPGYASTWVGIGGFTTHDLIQAGVSESTSSPRYFPWYEMLPASATPISKPASPGDNITVTITKAGTNRWTISMTDAGRWSWIKTFSYHSSQSSAEWILEAPFINGHPTTLPGLSTSVFGTTSTYVQGGSTRTIAQGNPVKILMLKRSGKREATPSTLASDGQSFDVCAYKNSCATP